MFPSDMGFPVHVEVNAPVTVSIMGKASFKPESLLPSISLTGKTVLATQYSGVVSTVCPFTREYLVTGINQHSVINVPGSIEVKLDIPSQKLAVFVKPSGQSPTVLGHYNIMPYTTIGQINKLQMLSKTPALKPIKSISPRKQMSTTFGEMLGLSLKTELETESGFVDMRSVAEYIAIYKNPLNLMIFGWTSPALSEQLVPSVRYHRMTTIFDPAHSSTKELGIEVKVGVATKIVGDAMLKYHTLVQKTISSLSKSEITEIMTNPTLSKLISALSPLKIVTQSISTQVHQRRQQILKEVIGQLESTSLEPSKVTGFTITTSLVLKSTRPRTFTYVLTAATGSRTIPESKKIHQEWNIVLESQLPQAPVKSINVRGHVDIPILPMWNVEQLRQTLINFDFNNEIAFTMANGQKSKVITTGSGKTSEAQKSFSRQSPEALKLARGPVSPFPLNVTGPVSPFPLNATFPVIPWTPTLEDTIRVQATTLDKIVFETNHVNVPKVFERMEMTFIETLRVYLWPYYTPSDSTIENVEFESGSYKTTTEMTFRQGTPSFDLKIVMPTQKVFFSNVRIAYPFSLFFPLTAVRSNVRLGLAKVASGPVQAYESCQIRGNHMYKFIGKTIQIPADSNSTYVLAADFSSFHRFIVKGQYVMGQWIAEITLKKNIIEVQKRGPHDIQVRINGQPVEFSRSNGWTVMAKDINDQSDIAEVQYTPVYGWEQVSIKAPRFLLEEVKTDGQNIEVVPSAELKGKLGGLCGNTQKPIRSVETLAGHCVYSKPELEIASWIVPTGSSSSTLSPSLLSQLKRETEICSKVTVQPTQVAKAYKAFTGKCTVLKHTIQEDESQKRRAVCVSRVPITGCGPSCKSRADVYVEKEIPFVCFPKNGTFARSYYLVNLRRRVQRGELMPELEDEHYVTAFTRKIRMPPFCKHTLVTPVAAEAGCFFQDCKPF